MPEKVEKNFIITPRDAGEGRFNGKVLPILAIVIAGFALATPFIIYAVAPPAPGQNGVAGQNGTNGTTGRDGTGISYIVMHNGSGVYVAYPGRAGFSTFSGTNASLVIQSALNAVNNSGGGIVQLEAGSWPLDTCLEIGANTTLQGEGDATQLIPASASDMTALIYPKAGSPSNIILREFMIDGRKATCNISSPITMTAIGGGCIIERIHIECDANRETMQYGISAMGQDLTIRNCYIKDPMVGILLFWVVSANIEDNLIEGNLDCPTTQIGMLATIALNTNIRGNTFNYLADVGLQLSGVSQSAVTDNHFSYCINDTRHWNFNSPKAAIVLNGTFFLFGHVRTEDVVVSGNSIYDSGFDGIDVMNGTRYCTFTANTIEKCQWDGMYLEGASIPNHQATTEKNVISDTQTDGNNVSGGGFYGITDKGEYNVYSSNICEDGFWVFNFAGGPGTGTCKATNVWCGIPVPLYAMIPTPGWVTF